MKNENKLQNRINQSTIDFTFKNIKTIKNHNDRIKCLYLLSDGRLASCANDKTINIYSMSNDYNCDITMNGHTDNVNCISQLVNGKVISCSADKSIKIWNITKSSYECEYTITSAHMKYIHKVMSLSNNRIASCSEDQTIKIWNSNHPYNKVKTLQGQEEPITSILQLKGKEIASSYNNLCEWNLSTYQCESIINHIQCFYINCLIQLDDNRIIVGGIPQISVINITTFLIEQKLIQDKSSCNFRALMILRDGNILCGCHEGMIAIYNLKLNTLEIKDIKAHSFYISCFLRIDNHHFISSSGDNTIKVWEY